ncbi:DUF551 domain-containing protein [Serratia fonticola]|uniref:DUF551 domain-containing protein n=1 Tax=Serratia fonticola TaxID=47917 RepID=UPI0034C6BEE7
MTKPRLSPRMYADCVNMLQEVAIAFHGTGQLRARLNSVLGQYVEPDHPHTRATTQENTPKAALGMAPTVNIGNMENTSGWIACSDSMPTDETTVLVSNEENVVWIADVDHGGQFYPDEFPVAKMSAGEITHWMSLPTAPAHIK